MQRSLIALTLVFGFVVSLAPAMATAQQTAPQMPTAPPLVIKPLAEVIVTQLPAGPLYWRLENYPTLAQAQAAAGPTGLVTQSAGKIWLITLGAAGGASAGGTKVAEIGPLPDLAAARYRLRVNEASGAPGSITAVHSHPGSETFYVLAGETSSHTPDGVLKVGVGHGQIGHAAGTPMQVSSSGSSDLLSLVMFLVDADKPFAAPATFP